MKLVSIEVAYPIHHTGYTVNITSDIDNKVKYIYFWDYEKSQIQGQITMSLRSLISREHSGGFTKAVQLKENESSVTRNILVIYLDENLKPIGYQENEIILNKVNVKIPNNVKEILNEEINKHIYIGNDDYLKFDATEYFTNNSAKYMSYHFSTKELSLEDELKRKEIAYEAPEITESNGRYYSKSNILSLLGLENKPSFINTMIVFYDENFEVVAYGKRKIPM